MAGPYDHIEQIPVNDDTRPDERVVDLARRRVDRMKAQAEADAKKREAAEQRRKQLEEGPDGDAA